MKDILSKIGQLFMFGFDGVSVSPQVKGLIRDYRIGGVILFAKNIEGPDQLKELCHGLQSLHSQVSEFPLFIAIDQEGGVVNRIEEGVAVFPGAMALGATRSEEYAYQAGKITALELGTLGININLAPVLDINTNPHNPGIGIRSFSDSSGLVSKLGTAFIKGLQDHGMSATAKHFPGKGDARVDSHISLPTISHPIKRLMDVEIRPFAKAISGGVHLAMSSHASYPGIEEKLGLPGTLSCLIQRNLLRDRFGFEGLVITDDLGMGAISEGFGIGEAAVLALEAGADILLVCHKPERQMEAYQAVLSAVKDGRIKEGDIEKRISRIKVLKEWHLAQKGKEKEIEYSLDEHLAMARKMAREAITLVRKGMI